MPSTLTAKSQMTLLCQSFPSLRGKPGTSPWDATRFAHWASSSPLSAGERHAVLFVLTVWNNWHPDFEEPWFNEPPLSLGRFDAIDAMRTWDEPHQNAFTRWCMDPFWP